MHKKIRLTYVVNSQEYSFVYDTTSSTHQQRILTTIAWACRNDVDIIITPAGDSANASINRAKAMAARQSA